MSFRILVYWFILFPYCFRTGYADASAHQYENSCMVFYVTYSYVLIKIARIRCFSRGCKTNSRTFRFVSGVVVDKSSFCFWGCKNKVKVIPSFQGVCKTRDFFVEGWRNQFTGIPFCFKGSNQLQASCFVFGDVV